MKVKENGMSLIALVVTIIVLILLAGVTISNIRNDSGLFNKSLEARDEKIASEENEAIQWAAAQAVADDSNKTGQIIDKGQIAEKLDKTSKGVDSAIQRAKKKLAEIIDA